MTKIETYIDNLKINYIKKGSGKTVLIIPGWGTVINTYTTLLNSISTYANVLCLDMPGFGESNEPPKSWNLDDYITLRCWTDDVDKNPGKALKLDIDNGLTNSGRAWHLHIDNCDCCSIGSADLNSIEQFNKLMEVFDSNFRL